MSMRTPNTTMSRQSLLDLQRTKERLALNNARIASGNQITNPGDDPAGSAMIVDFGDSIQANVQYIKQADSALGYLSSSEDAISAAINDVERLMELVQSGSASSAPEVDAIRTNLLNLANTQVQGKYLFGGAQTQGTAAHPAPFEDAAPPAGPVNYWGDSGLIKLNTSTASTVATNIPGDQVFFGPAQGSTADIFKQVTDLRDNLKAGTLNKQTMASNLQDVLNNLLKNQTEMGGRQAGLSDLKDILSGFNVTLESIQSSRQATDYPQAISDYTSDQTIQSATLSALAKSTRQNLFDYLG